MDLRRYARALRRSWWVIVVLALAGGAGGYGYSKRQTPVYAAHLTFYVASPALNSADANSTNQFAQDRAASYAGLAGSDRLARQVVAATPGLGLSARTVSQEISGSAQLNTILIDVEILDSSKRRALSIGQAMGTQFPIMVSELDRTRVGQDAVALTVVSGPRVSAAPVSPRTRLNTIIGFALGLLLGLALAVLRELLDVSISGAEPLAEFTGLPTLAAVSQDSAIKTSPLVIGDMAHSPRAEAMRQLRTNLRFMDATSPVRTLVVTSASDAEGKSTVSANLALVMAETGRRVLLIEADLRKPRVSELFGIGRAVGLSNVLAGQGVLGDFVRQWGESTLSVLPAGPVPPNPSELLGSQTMVDVLESAAAHFDMVIIDTPPLRPVTDAAVVAAEADATIVVFWQGHTKRALLHAALLSLETVNARVLGCVLNRKPLTRAERRGYTAYAPDRVGRGRRGPWRRRSRSRYGMASGSPTSAFDRVRVPAAEELPFAAVIAAEPPVGPLRLDPPASVPAADEVSVPSPPTTEEAPPAAPAAEIETDVVPAVEPAPAEPVTAAESDSEPEPPPETSPAAAPAEPGAVAEPDSDPAPAASDEPAEASKSESGATDANRRANGTARTRRRSPAGSGRRR